MSVAYSMCKHCHELRNETRSEVSILFCLKLATSSTILHINLQPVEKRFIELTAKEETQKLQHMCCLFRR